MSQDPTQAPGHGPWPLAAMTGVWLLLALWSGLADHLGCGIALVPILLLWGLILLAGGEAALLRRHLFIRACLEPGGRLARWLDRRSLLFLWQGLKALALALVLVITLPLLQAPQWLLLLADILLLGILLWFLGWLLRGEAMERYQAALARAWAQRVNAVLLWLGLLLSLLFTPRHDYGSLVLTEAMRHGAAQVQLDCDALAVLARAGAILESALWWSAQRLFSGLEGLPMALLAWLGFLALFGASFLVAWAWSRVLGGVLARPWHLVAGSRGS